MTSIADLKRLVESGAIKTDGLSDPVNSPSHYMHGDIETIEIIRAMLTLEEYRGYLKGNIIKYRERAPYKGKTDEDYAKAKRYYDWLREVASE